MKKYLIYIPSIVFNIAEILIIFFFGQYLGVPIIQIILILVLFTLVRISIGSPLHFKDWKKCMFWSTLIFISFFYLAKIEIWVSLIIVVFSAVILTKHGDIQGNIGDTFMYKPKKATKYNIIDNYINNDKFKEEIIDFENRLKLCSESNIYQIYEIRFHHKDKNGEYPSLEEIEKQTNIPKRRIVEYLDHILLSFKIFFKIKK